MFEEVRIRERKSVKYEYVRVELVKFYEEYYIWSDFGGAHGTPEKISPSVEGANLEKIVVFKFYNKCDHKVRLYKNYFSIMTSQIVCMKDDIEEIKKKLDEQ